MVENISLCPRHANASLPPLKGRPGGTVQIIIIHSSSLLALSPTPSFATPRLFFFDTKGKGGRYAGSVAPSPP